MTSLAQRKTILSLIAEAQKAGATLKRACATIVLTKRTVQHWREHACVQADQRTLTHNSPAHKLSAAERTNLLVVANAPGHGHLPPSQLVPTLADQGMYLASESTFYRVLDEANQLHHRRGERAATARARPRHIVTDGPNQCYSWDITYLPTTVRGQYFYLYMHVDIFSRKIVGWAVHEQESSEHASALLKAIYRVEKIQRDQLISHSDNGSPMKGSALLATFQKLGITKSRSRPACSDDNPYSEALFRTLKYRPDLPVKPFIDLVQASAWVEKLVHWYNHKHRHSAIGFVTPDQRHRGEDCALLRRRHELYALAKAKNPTRWSGRTRNWQRVQRVDLNPQKTKEE